VKVFIDSNIPMYIAVHEHPNRAPALRFMERVQAGTVQACTSTEVLQEILYRYSAIGRRDLAGKVYDLFVSVCPVVFPTSLADTDRARALIQEISQISARNAVHAAVMLNHSIEWIATFDRGFEQVPGIRRFGLS